MSEKNSFQKFFVERGSSVLLTVMFTTLIGIFYTGIEAKVKIVADAGDVVIKKDFDKKLTDQRKELKEQLNKIEEKIDKLIFHQLRKRRNRGQ